MLVAGLAIQVVSLVLFISIHAWFALGLRDSSVQRDPQHISLTRTAKFKRFLLGKSLPVSRH